MMSSKGRRGARRQSSAEAEEEEETGLTLLAVDDEEVTIVVDDGDISSLEPAVLGDGIRGGLAVAPVALHDAGSLDPQLASPALLGVLAIIVDESGLEVGLEAADRAELAGLLLHGRDGDDG